MLHRSGGIIEPNWIWRDIPGIVLCAFIACAATWMALLAGSAVIWGLIFGLVLFVVAALLNASGLVPRELLQVTTPLSRFCLVTSMAAIGLTLPWRSIRAFGLKPFMLLLILSVTLIGLSLAYVKYHSF